MNSVKSNILSLKYQRFPQNQADENIGIRTPKLKGVFAKKGSRRKFIDGNCY